MADRIGLTREWIVLALSDRTMAQRAAEIAPTLPRQTCFHAQQAVEKVLKAFLTYHGIVFEKTHSIGRLCTLAADIDADFRKVLTNYDRLSDYAVEFRYPDSEDPTASEMDEAIVVAGNAIGFVLGRLPADCGPPESLPCDERKTSDDSLP